MKNEQLIRRFQIERKKFDRSGIYAYTQRTLAYNSNKIEGSTLNEEQTASLFDTGMLPVSNDYYRAKDVEETNGHFLMFNKMIDTLDETLSEALIKAFHYELKSGVFEDRANGYAIGEYKKRPNMIGIYETSLPEDVPEKIQELLALYHEIPVKPLAIMAQFHARYESLHPFQDGNGRTGRLILFRECLKADLIPVVIEDRHRSRYIGGLKEYREAGETVLLQELFQEEQLEYAKKVDYFLGEEPV